MTQCVSPLQSFLVVRDAATSQPSLLCVSAGGEDGAVLDYNMKSTDKGMDQSHSDNQREWMSDCFAKVGAVKRELKIFSNKLVLVLSLPRHKMASALWMRMSQKRQVAERWMHLILGDFPQLCSVQLMVEWASERALVFTFAQPIRSFGLEK